MALCTLRVTAYFEPAICYGGPAVSVPAACRALVEAGTAVTVFTTTANGDTELPASASTPVDLDGVKVHYFPRHRPRRYFRSPELARALDTRTAGFDVLHLHGVFCDTNRTAARAARKHAVPYVITIHGTLDPLALRRSALRKCLYMSLVERQVLNGAARLIALTEAEHSQIEALHLRPPITVIPNGLDARQFASLPGRDAVDAHHPWLAGHPYILYLGRLHPKKGLDLLIDALPAVLRQHPEWRLVIAGPDEDGYRAQIEAQIRRLGLQKAAVPIGPVTGQGKLGLLRNAELLCLPSHTEGLPTSVVEAMFCARPVLITEACYMPEVRDQGAGLVVPDELEPLTRGLVQVTGMDAPARRAMGEQGRAFALKRYEAGEVTRLTQRMYEQVVQEAPKARRFR
ncbi:MAG: glycosyltransferase [Armatimonadetes bacterium]|nr:glycosyltransferase [Armatimonadota bacterium]